ncbi:MAG TPA: 50S ribosomal protein L3 N(5)-glutamine methyltransferase [Chromatiaceae bacterium]|jgi:ribosomal protein L3 glutamine methyltransferase|nr:MAG: 50S ribosomal protein L3 N(5)-glutamine methyltransferase [Thiohalocapsa sp. PB-PSB1]HBG94864.1 50S ribosomal protein L3 N(5)-glutamine methyltransferase [Chromatiaceae bacterium]HCS89800.1 50S ribosomal protein L3 N(5)-glutamine methyltransferase [Chromatiaceae bacterium]
MAVDTNALLTIQDLVRWSACRFADARLHFGHGTDNAFDEAAWLIASSLNMPLEHIGPYRECRVTEDERTAVLALVRRRIVERRPAAYLIGQTRFAGMEFIVNDSVMIPRSPIAELIADGFAPWVDPERIHRVLDLCTGCGCLGIALAAYLPEIEVDLADISPAALRIAARNLALHDLDDRVRIIESDLFAGIGQIGGSPSAASITEPASEQIYDIIISNPPYVGNEEMESLPAEYQHEPRLALAAGETGLDLVLRILRDAPDYLDDEGILVVEVGNTAAALQACFPDLPFTWLDFEHGGEGVFLLRREELVQGHQRFSEAVANL